MSNRHIRPGSKARERVSDSLVGRVQGGTCTCAVAPSAGPVPRLKFLFRGFGLRATVLWEVWVFNGSVSRKIYTEDEKALECRQAFIDQGSGHPSGFDSCSGRRVLCLNCRCPGQAGARRHFSYNLWSLTFLEELTLKQFYFKWKSGSEAAHG